MEKRIKLSGNMIAVPLYQPGSEQPETETVNSQPQTDGLSSAPVLASVSFWHKCAKCHRLMRVSAADTFVPGGPKCQWHWHGPKLDQPADVCNGHLVAVSENPDHMIANVNGLLKCLVEYAPLHMVPGMHELLTAVQQDAEAWADAVE